MIKRGLKNWKDISDLQGMLFFVQRMDELLFHYSMDTYKTPTLNIKLLLREYLETVDSIKEGLLKDKNELPIFEEIVWSLKEDIAAQKIIGISKTKEFLKNHGSYDSDMKRKVCQLFLDKLSSRRYLEEIEMELKNAVLEDRKKEIELCSKYLVRELTVLGYNSRFIFSCLNKVFFLKSVNDVASLETFFSCFDSEVKGYSVYFIVHKELAKFSGLLSEKMPENSIVILDNNKIPKGIQKIEGYSVIEIKNLNAYDEYSAYEMGKSIIGLLNHFYSFFRYVENGIYKNGFVKVGENKIKYIKESVSGIEKSKRTKSFAVSSTSALNLFDMATTNYENLYKLSRIMEIHNMALGIQSPSNALLSLWSILELLLEKEKNDNDRSRIFNIIDLVTPYLINSYIEKIVKNLLSDLQRWSKRKTDAVLSGITVGRDGIEKLFAFIALEVYDDKRKELYRELEAFPLLRFRIFTLNEQFGTKKNLNRMLNEHEKKVRWHLQRIYRARNRIIHDGDDIMNIENLVENLLFYVDIICERIIQKIGGSGYKYTVSDAIVEENLQAKDYQMISETISDIDDKNSTIFLYHSAESIVL